MTDEELLTLQRETGSLVPEARTCLLEELRKRKLLEFEETDQVVVKEDMEPVIEAAAVTTTAGRPSSEYVPPKRMARTSSPQKSVVSRT